MEAPQQPAAQRVRARDLWGALGWSAIFCLTPFDFLFLGSVVLIPLLVACEVKRTKAVGFWPGFAWRAAIIAGIFALASAATPKFEHRLVKPPAQAGMTLETYCQLLRAQKILFLVPESHRKTALTVPTEPRSVAEVISHIEQQTGLSGRIQRCMHGQTLPAGPYCAVSFRPAETTSHSSKP